MLTLSKTYAVKTGRPRFLFQIFKSLHSSSLLYLNIEMQIYNFYMYFRSMEFRIAPMILVLFNLFFITLANPTFNEWIPLKELASFSKVLIPFGLVFVLSVGTFIRHTYYSKQFKFTYYGLQLLNLAMLVFYIYAIKQQHL